MNIDHISTGFAWAAWLSMIGPCPKVLAVLATVVAFVLVVVL